MPFSDVRGSHIVNNIFRLKDTVSLYSNFGNGWSLEDSNDEDIAFPTHLDLVEVLGSHQGANNFSWRAFANHVTNSYRQQIIDNARRDALIAIYNNICNGEILRFDNSR